MTYSYAKESHTGEVEYIAHYGVVTLTRQRSAGFYHVWWFDRLIAEGSYDLCNRIFTQWGFWQSPQVLP